MVKLTRAETMLNAYRKTHVLQLEASIFFCSDLIFKVKVIIAFHHTEDGGGVMHHVRTLLEKEGKKTSFSLISQLSDGNMQIRAQTPALIQREELVMSSDTGGELQKFHHELPFTS